ncbi:MULTISPECIES: dTDP-4-dehydrorhamnose 3,5-epimerase [unclassified Methylophaga]|jgi:dTDP-4-dehydrorhamnose 3,5-epimerase|uniref:dTDP-4-dehydrorhamnose 3,5-epimerase n=1 Tax=unclassified Methylophaga TaxID=2629249 RepID=UPI0025EB780B|nr:MULTISPECIES: dTDP-4-dehydrorhamnose 3,5-epimerase [unclassified Methylophaga]|tara:strand:+ start:1917 stop:2465 length:549 start_codon:yes stop_codon:yes gene_type:complete
MQVFNTNLPDVKLLKPKKFGDERGFFLESYNKKVFDDLIGMNVDFVQDNHSRSSKGVLRGLHYQIRQPQGKLVRVTAGKVYDVAVDMRRDSPTFGQWAGTILTAEGQEQFWVPEGFAHGFLVLSDTADFLYKTTNYYAPEHDRSVLWNDKTIGIEWPISDSLQPTLSDKDRNAVEFNQADYF